MVSYETARRWVNHFGLRIAADLRKRRPKPHTTWHLDEVYLKIDGRMVDLWRAVDAEGEVLDQLRLFLHAGAYWLMWGLSASMPRRSTMARCAVRHVAPAAHQSRRPRRRDEDR